MLAGDLGNDGLTEQLITGSNVPRLRSAPQIAIPAFHAFGRPETWIKPGAKALEFRTAGQAQDVTLEPINSIFGVVTTSTGRCRDDLFHAQVENGQ